MFGREKRKSATPTPVFTPAPRVVRKGGMENVLVFAEKCAGRRLAQWEADVMEALVKAVNESEAMHG